MKGISKDSEGFQRISSDFNRISRDFNGIQEILKDFIAITWEWGVQSQNDDVILEYVFDKYAFI